MPFASETIVGPSTVAEPRTPQREARGKRHCDAVVIGGGLKGIITTYILSNAGYRTMLIEKAPQLGGLMGSFSNAHGRLFDFGYHALDRNRSPFATRFVASMLGDKVRTYLLNRAIVLRSGLIPYNAPISEWPESLRTSAGTPEIADTNFVNPTREDLYPIYGRFLTDLVFNEAMRSYPALCWRLQAGRSEHELTDWIYPWFFPRAARHGVRRAEWHQYHDAVRECGAQEVMYPAEGGQAALPEAIVSRFAADHADVRTGCVQCDYEVRACDRRILSVQLGDETVTAEQYFWCGSVAQLCGLFDVALPTGVAQRLLLGSFEFSSTLDCPYHEILVGDPEHLINRISLPGKVAGMADNLVQVEFAIPEGQAPSRESLQEQWTASLRRLGIVAPDNTVVDFDYRSLPWGMVTVEDLGSIVDRWRRELTHPASNVFHPFLGAGPESTSRLVPEVFRNVVACIAR